MTFNIHHHHYHHADPRVDELLMLLREVLCQQEKLHSIVRQIGDATMSVLDSLTAQVAQNTSVEQSAVVLIQGMAQQIQDLATQLANGTADATQAQALADQLKASSDALAAAVTANTVPPTPSSAST